MNNKEKIKDVCLELFIQNGIEGTSTKMILEETSISNGGLFHHFPTKEDIVKEIFIDIKKHYKTSTYDLIDHNQSFRSLIFNYWNKGIRWSLDHPDKKMYLEMYSNSATLRNCTDYNSKEHFADLVTAIDKAIERRDIISPNLDFFLIHYIGYSDAIIEYLTEYPADYTDSFLEQQFTQYWRSVVNF